MNRQIKSMLITSLISLGFTLSAFAERSIPLPNGYLENVEVRNIEITPMNGTEFFWETSPGLGEQKKLAKLTIDVNVTSTGCTDENSFLVDYTWTHQQLNLVLLRRIQDPCKAMPHPKTIRLTKIVPEFPASLVRVLNPGM
ncbi:MAG: hypothetical protein AB7F43_10950 [Bacteriovoracia bacterium]